MTFEVDDVICDALTADVAAEMIGAAKNHWLLHRATRRRARATDLAMDRYFFAVWPELAQLLTEGKVPVKVARTMRPRTDIGEGSVSYSYRRDERQLNVSFHLPNWFVRLTFVEQGAQAERFREIVEAVERRHEK